LSLTGPEAVLTACRGERIKRRGAAPSRVGRLLGRRKLGGCKPTPLLPPVRTPHDEAKAELQPAANTPDRWEEAKLSRRTRFGCGGLHEIFLGRREGRGVALPLFIPSGAANSPDDKILVGG